MKPNEPLLLDDGTSLYGMYPAGKVFISWYLKLGQNKNGQTIF